MITKEIYEELVAISNRWKSMYYEKKEEIERLTKQNKALNEMYELTKKEYIRLNNIIEKLNCGIKELDDMFFETFRISQNGYYSISEWELKEFTDKIKELKGSE